MKYGGKYEEWRTLLEKSQWWDNHRLRDYQVAQLSKLAMFVYEHCQYYHARMEEAGITPTSIDSIESVKRLPIIDKSDVRANHGGIRTHLGSSRTLTLYTSGTTGTALRVPMTRETFQREYAFRWQFQSVASAKRGDRFAYFTGHHLFMPERSRTPFWIRNYPANSIMFSLYHMAESTLGEYLKALNAFGPLYVSGYPSGIYLLAAYALDKGLRIQPPRAVFTASEKLHRHQRDAIQRGFGAPVYEWYGQVETTGNLQECEHHRLHIKEEYGLLEILKGDGSDALPGETGHVVATGWGNKAFPLVRYRTGDNMILAEDQSCPCGRGGRIVKEILGRDEDFVVTPEGRFVGRLDFVFKSVSTVKESQIVQENEHTICVKVVPLENYSTRDEQLIVNMLRERVGGSMTVYVEKVSEIPRQQNGKIRYVISRVPQSLTRQKM